MDDLPLRTRRTTLGLDVETRFERGGTSELLVVRRVKLREVLL